ncbi:hypothetical protein GGX14DRAFT_437558 [Mycena pura]|uniref:DUF6534 domain-containing protein n=1 Tax=Mycena pura TaxID=153505 RepID=A0AAD6VW34_9AGAR|nr:hypothetical protein GGX14DRAFT_437558 [Mycena pura]
MSDLPSTVGIWLVTAFVEAILQGMGLLQGFLYFTWYHKDPWSVKATVGAVLDALECVQMGASVANVYEWFITGFGNFDNLNMVFASPSVPQARHVATYSTSPVRHFARCIYQLDKKNIFLPSIICAFALLALGSGIGLHPKPFQSHNPAQVTNVLQTAAALAADMLITFGLCWRLRKCRSEFQSTNKILNFLILTAINRSVFTMFFAVLNMILFLSRPQTFDFMIALFISDKLYMNSLLAMLNTREFAVQGLQSSGARAEHIAMPHLSSTGSRNKQSAAVYIQTTTEVRNDVGGRFELESMKIEPV